MFSDLINKLLKNGDRSYFDQLVTDGSMKPSPGNKNGRRRKRILHWCLQKWIIVYLGRVARRPTPSALDLVPYFQQWRRWTRSARSHHHMVDRYYQRRCVSKAISKWIAAYNESLARCQNQNRMRSVWIHWKMSMLIKRLERRRRLVTMRRWRKLTTAMMLEGLNKAIRCRKAIRHWVVHCQRFSRIERAMKRIMGISRLHWESQARRDILQLRIALGGWKDTMQALKERDALLNRRTHLKLAKRSLIVWITKCRRRCDLQSAAQILDRIWVNTVIRISLSKWIQFVNFFQCRAKHVKRLELACRRVRWSLAVREYTYRWRAAIVCENITINIWERWIAFVQFRRTKRKHERRLMVKLTGNPAISIRQWQQCRLKQFTIDFWIMETATKYLVAEQERRANEEGRKRRKAAHLQAWMQQCNYI